MRRPRRCGDRRSRSRRCDGPGHRQDPRARPHPDPRARPRRDHRDLRPRPRGPRLRTRRRGPRRHPLTRRTRPRPPPRCRPRRQPRPPRQGLRRRPGSRRSRSRRRPRRVRARQSLARVTTRRGTRTAPGDGQCTPLTWRPVRLGVVGALWVVLGRALRQLDATSLRRGLELGSLGFGRTPALTRLLVLAACVVVLALLVRVVVPLLAVGVAVLLLAVRLVVVAGVAGWPLRQVDTLLFDAGALFVGEAWPARPALVLRLLDARPVVVRRLVRLRPGGRCDGNRADGDERSGEAGPQAAPAAALPTAGARSRRLRRRPMGTAHGGGGHWVLPSLADDRRPSTRSLRVRP